MTAPVRCLAASRRGENWWPSPLPTDDRLYVLDVRADLGMCTPPVLSLPPWSEPCGVIGAAGTVAVTYTNGTGPSLPPPPGDRVTYATATVEPSGDGEMFMQSFRYAAGRFTCELALGQPGRLYRVLIQANGASGLNYSWVVNILVSCAGALPPPPPPPPVAGPGFVSVWKAT